MTNDMIDPHGVHYIGGSPNIADWPITSEITELAFRSGTLHLRHTKEDAWPDVPFETTTQESTFWVFVNMDGTWYGTGAERIRPNQHDKPEPDRVSSWLAEWLYGPMWSPLTKYNPAVGESIGVCVTAGIERVADQAIVRERTPIYLVRWPGDAGGSFPPWAGTATGVTPSPELEPPKVQPPPAPAPIEPSSDLATVLARMNARFDHIERLAERSYTGTLTLPKVLGGGTRTITLHPVTPRNKPGDGA